MHSYAIKNIQIWVHQYRSLNRDWNSSNDKILNNDRNQYFEILAECNEEVIKDNSYQDNFEGEEDIDIEMETAMPRDVKGSAGGIAER